MMRISHERVVAAAESTGARVSTNPDVHDCILLRNAVGSMRWCLSPASDGDDWIGQRQVLHQDLEHEISEWVSDEAVQEVHSFEDVREFCRELGWG